MFTTKLNVRKTLYSKIFSGEIGTNIQNNSIFLALLIRETLMLKNEYKEKISRMV
jgi:hypothetical protein